MLSLVTHSMFFLQSPNKRHIYNNSSEWTNMHEENLINLTGVSSKVMLEKDIVLSESIYKTERALWTKHTFYWIPNIIFAVKNSM